MKQFSKIAGFQGIKRDELTRRATIQTKRYQCLVSPFLSINLSTQLPINRILLPHVFVKSPTNIPPPNPQNLYPKHPYPIFSTKNSLNCNPYIFCFCGGKEDKKNKNNHKIVYNSFNSNAEGQYTLLINPINLGCDDYIILRTFIAH